MYWTNILQGLKRSQEYCTSAPLERRRNFVKEKKVKIVLSRQLAFFSDDFFGHLLIFFFGGFYVLHFRAIHVDQL